MIYAPTPTDPHPPAKTLAVGWVRSSHFPRPHLLADIRAEFPAWATSFAARLLPGLSLPVADTNLHGRAWGLMSRSAGIRLDLAAMAAASDDRPALRQFHLATDALGILLHEIAHAACWKRPEERPALSPTEATAVVEEWARVDETAAPDPCPWFDDHGVKFLRAVLHVAHRAERLLGYGIVLLDIFAAEDYGLSSTYAYRRTLGTEPEDLEAVPFSTILETCPPRPFVALWKQDVQRWLDTIAEPTPKQVAAVEAAMSLFP